ncbi:MAG: ABC transporter permease subunit [Verrucomicrobiae bacterium]|nr:ABC transporter permease subunit [Verrucomicrobiae bacterium]
MWLVIQRELRDLARQPSLAGIRVLSAGLALVLFWLAWERASPGTIASGRGFFLGLNRLLFAGLWLAGPVLTADCLSREKREGTLGLLMLTPLRPVDVVVGKAVSEAARAFMGLLAVLPVLMIPLLLGGVGWMDALRMFLLQGAALGLALASGLAASSLTRTWWHARLLALGFAVVAGLGFLTLHGSLRMVPVALQAPVSSRPGILLAGVTAAWQELRGRAGLGPADGFDSWWHDGSGVPATGLTVLLAAGVCLVAGLLVMAMGFAAAAGIRHSWRLEPSWTHKRAGFWRWMASPISPAMAARRRSHLLDQNPVRWLQSRAWQARLGGWVLAGAVAGCFWLWPEPDRRASDPLHQLLRPALMGVVAFMATASFRIERESGGLELWMVTPLSPGTILRGRWHPLLARASGAWALMILLPYLPSAAQWLAGLELSPGRQQWLRQRCLLDLDYTVWLMATALLGTALSLSSLSFPTAFGFTWVLHHAPQFAATVAEWYVQEQDQRLGRPPTVWNARQEFLWLGMGFAGAVLAWSWWFGCRQLAERRFLPGLRSPRLPPRDIPGEVRAS